MENKKNIIYPGTIFTARHFDQFTQKFKVHPFVCIYNQSLDPSLDGESNIIGLLISSNNKQFSKQVYISKKDNPFLEKDSYCYCLNIYTFQMKDIVIIGMMDAKTFFEIVQKRQLLLRAENDQCVQSLMNIKSFETKKIVEINNEKKLKIKKANKKKNKKNFSKDNFNNIDNKDNNITIPKLQIEASYFPNQENLSVKKLPNRNRNLSLINKNVETEQEKQERDNFKFEEDGSKPLAFDNIDKYISDNLDKPKEQRDPFFKKKPNFFKRKKND